MPNKLLDCDSFQFDSFQAIEDSKPSPPRTRHASRLVQASAATNATTIPNTGDDEFDPLGGKRCGKRTKGQIE